MVDCNPIDKDYIVRWQSDLENTKERPIHKPSQDQSKSTVLGGVWNFAEQWIHYQQQMYVISNISEKVVSKNLFFCILKKQQHKTYQQLSVP